jgi:epoxyqueuosine reductase QueG
MRLEEEITALVPEDGEHLMGFADLTGLLHQKYHGFEYAVSIGRKLDGVIIDAIAHGPTREYAELYRDTNRHLEELASGIAARLTERGVRALAITPTMDEEEGNPEYPETLRTTFSHKMAATRAGLGWIGKTDLLVTEEFGPRLRLVTVLAGRPLQPLRPPIDSSRCGECGECVRACPAGAANGRLWDIRTDRDEFYDAFACRRKARELSRRRIKRDVSICGICVSVCPRGSNTA